MRVCVYGSSSAKTPQVFTDAAYQLGQELAKRGHICVNGGGASGVMGALNSGCAAGGGQMVGVIHEMFVVDGQEDSRIQKMIVCKGNDLKERKQLLLDNADAIMVMPGGVGTLDELWDAVCTKSLGLGGLSNKPIAVVNVDGYYDGSIAQLKEAEKRSLLYSKASVYFEVFPTSAEALDWCAAQVHAAQSGVNAQVAHKVWTRQEKSAVNTSGQVKTNEVKSPNAVAAYPTDPYAENDGSDNNSKNGRSGLLNVCVGVAIGVSLTLLFSQLKRR
jgi:uncharacterized protein (TIGR00730 family)